MCGGEEERGKGCRLIKWNSIFTTFPPSSFECSRFSAKWNNARNQYKKVSISSLSPNFVLETGKIYERVCLSFGWKVYEKCSCKIAWTKREPAIRKRMLPLTQQVFVKVAELRYLNKALTCNIDTKRFYLTHLLQSVLPSCSGSLIKQKKKSFYLTHNMKTQQFQVTHKTRITSNILYLPGKGNTNAFF